MRLWSRILHDSVPAMTHAPHSVVRLGRPAQERRSHVAMLLFVRSLPSHQSNAAECGSSSVVVFSGRLHGGCKSSIPTHATPLARTLQAALDGHAACISAAVHDGPLTNARIRRRDGHVSEGGVSTLAGAAESAVCRQRAVDDSAECMCAALAGTRRG